MAKHTGSELNNIRETWDRNEREQRQNNSEDLGDATTVNRDLQETIKKEAAEYDNADKDERVLDGERATVNDNDNPDEA